ncbi:uncharacterized protein LOC135503403 [Lineus longissimus]|uniref:uncharacterized protein LOC135503403 n=1 Tax=Lineus longissimus TaxID=88925 RepID=UPI00315C4FC4
MAARHLLSVAVALNSSLCLDKLLDRSSNGNMSNETISSGEISSGDQAAPDFDLSFGMAFVVSPTICVIGIVGNAFALAVFRRYKRSSSAHFLLKALAIVDMGFLFNMLLFDFVQQLFYTAYFDETVHTRNFGNVLWVTGVCIYVFELATVYMIVVITIDRFIHIRFPMKAQRMNTLRNAKIGVAAITILTIGMSIPEFGEYYMYQDPCREAPYFTVGERAYGQDHGYIIGFKVVTVTLVYDVIPMFFIILPLNVVVLTSLRKIVLACERINCINHV